MQHPARSVLPEGIPPEGLRILRAESEADLERRFAEMAGEGYVPAQKMEVKAHFDESSGEWRTLFVLPLWKVGSGGESPGTEEMFG